MINKIPCLIRRWFLALILLLPAGQAFTQSDPRLDKKLHFGLTAEAGRPIGDFEKNHKSGLGGTVFISWNIQEEAQITLSGGYIHFKGKSFEDDYLIYKIDDWKAVPIRIGGRYYATPHLFFKAETGAVFFIEPGKGTSIILSPGVGLQLHPFDVALKLETWTDGGTVSYAGLNLGYFF